MKLTRQPGFSLLAALLMVVSNAPGRADISGAELRAAYQWFDGLGYPDVGNLPFIRIQSKRRMPCDAAGEGT
jgi:hypothetical protein